MDEDEELRRAAEASELEAKLRGDVIVEVSPAQSLPGAHAGKRRVVLESGLICIAKPDGGCPDWPHAAACEAAAWIVARSLRLPCLVPVTVRLGRSHTMLIAGRGFPKVSNDGRQSSTT